MKTRYSVEYKLLNPFFNFILHACHIKTGCHTSFIRKDSPLAPFFSHHFLILEEIWLVGEGVTTPNMGPIFLFFLGHMQRNFTSLQNCAI